MAKFYGMVVGNRSEATRCGTSNSGIKATVQSWHGSVISELNTSDNVDDPRLRLEVSDYSKTYGDVIYNGSLKDFMELGKLIHKIGSDKVKEILTEAVEGR